MGIKLRGEDTSESEALFPDTGFDFDLDLGNIISHILKIPVGLGDVSVFQPRGPVSGVRLPTINLPPPSILEGVVGRTKSPVTETMDGPMIPVGRAAPPKFEVGNIRLSTQPNAPVSGPLPPQIPVRVLPPGWDEGKINLVEGNITSDEEGTMDLGDLIGQLGSELIKAKFPGVQVPVGGVPTALQPFVSPTFPENQVPVDVGIPGIDIIPDSSGMKGFVWNPRANCGAGKWVRRSRRRRKRLATAGDIKDIAALKSVAGPAILKTWIATHPS